MPPSQHSFHKLRTMASLTDDAVRREMSELKQNPPTHDERSQACRSLVRFRRGQNDADSPIGATEDCARLYVALRRASAGGETRISACHLQQWRTRVSQSTTVMRKVFLVKKADLDAMPAYPEGLDQWVIPRGELELPADIYEDDVVLIDDGYDRSKLKLPGVLHLQVSAKWSRGHPSGRSSGSGSSAGVLALPQPAAQEATNIPSQAAQTAPAAPPAPAVHSQRAQVPAPGAGAAGDSESEKAMADIISHTVKALGLGRWASSDRAQPNTVEFWVRIFTNFITKNPKD